MPFLPLSEEDVTLCVLKAKESFQTAVGRALLRSYYDEYNVAVGFYMQAMHIETGEMFSQAFRETESEAHVLVEQCFPADTLTVDFALAVQFARFVALLFSGRVMSLNERAGNFPLPEPAEMPGDIFHAFAVLDPVVAECVEENFIPLIVDLGMSRGVAKIHLAAALSVHLAVIVQYFSPEERAALDLERVSSLKHDLSLLSDAVDHFWKNGVA